MKKIYVMLALAMVVSFSGCGNKPQEINQEPSATPAGEVITTEEKTQVEKDIEKEPAATPAGEIATDEIFSDEDGKMVAVDTEAGLLDVPSLKTVVDKEAKIIEIYPADENGEVGDDYYLFDLNTNTYEKYSFISAMGKGYYYTGDLATGELSKIEDMDHADSTESMKQSGRYEAAAEKTKNEIEQLKSYFETKYNMTMEEAVTN